MRTRFFRLIVLLAGLFLLSSCFSYRDIEVKDFTINNVSMQGTKILVDFSATVYNPNRVMVIQQAAGDFIRGGQAFAAAQLMQPITLMAKSEQRYSGALQFTLKSLMAALQLGADYKSWEMNSFLFTGDMYVKFGGVKKKFSFKEMPLNQLINNLR